MPPRIPRPSWLHAPFINRPTAPIIFPQPPREEEVEVFIPPSPKNLSPVIPSTLHDLKVNRYRSSRGKWKHIPLPTEEGTKRMMDDEQKKYPTTVRIITWNVDFVADHKKERLLTALRHIERDVLGCKEGDAPFDPCCILLQEVHRDIFDVLLGDEWVRRHFLITPKSDEKWPEDAAYGNVTLVSRLLTPVKCEILHYGKSNMGRTALMVYILLSEPEPSAETVIICIINTHLESLPVGVGYRPQQLHLASRFLLQENGVRGGVIAGDMNTILPEDANIHLDADLRDAWRNRNQEDSKGYTWGLQEQDPGRYPPGRLDKILYLPRRGYKLDPPERIGVSLEIEGGGWVSDHYGLDSTLRLVVRRNSGSSS